MARQSEIDVLIELIEEMGRERGMKRGWKKEVARELGFVSPGGKVDDKTLGRLLKRERQGISVARLERVKQRNVRLRKMLAARPGALPEPEPPGAPGGDLTHMEMVLVFDQMKASGEEKRMAIGHLTEAEWLERKFKPDASYLRGWIMRGRFDVRRYQSDPPSDTRVITGG